MGISPLRGLLAQQARRVAKMRTAFRHFIGPSMPRLTPRSTARLRPELRTLTHRSAWRNCPKSLGRARSVARRAAKGGLFGLFHPAHTSQIHDRSVARTPFRTVSEGGFSEVLLGGLICSALATSRRRRRRVRR